MVQDNSVITIDDDSGGTSPCNFFATDVAKQWPLPSEVETDEIISDPSVEAWLFNNPDALASVRRGLSDAAQGKVSKVDLDTL